MPPFRLIRTLLACAGIALGAAPPALSQTQDPAIDVIAADAPRHALVIGVSNYTHAVKLKNTLNDADLMARTLTGLGFEVTTLSDPDLVTFNRALLDYANGLPSGAISVVFYAGHGMQVNGKNYLLPVEADPKSPDDLPFLTTSLDDLFRIFRNRGAVVNIFVLDACRNNPFEDDSVRSTIAGEARGLAPILTGFEGSLIAYATAPGKVAWDDGDGQNSPYTLALASAMQRPGLSLESVFKLARTQVIRMTEYKQIPWENSSLTREIFLAAPEVEPADDEVKVTSCDIEAGHPSDPDRVHPGIDYALMRPGPAIAACRADLAADPDNPRLMTNLARALAKAGESAEAIALNQRGVEMGYLGAYHNLGNHFRRGDGIAKDEKAAFDLFLYAAERGHPEDAYNIGNMYWRGEGVAQDFAKAYFWFDRAAQQDYPTAFDRLGLMTAAGEGVPADPVAAVAFYARGADLGDSSAMVNLGTAYRKGEGVGVDFTRAYDLFYRAALLRRRSAYTNLAEMHRKGEGVVVDMVEALFWYELAGRAGHKYSQEQAAEIAKTMDERQLQDIEDRVQQWINSNFG